MSKKLKAVPAAPAIHFFASSAIGWGWGCGSTRTEAIQIALSNVLPGDFTRNVTEHGGVFVQSCRVLLPLNANYTISNYRPEFISIDGKPTKDPVPMDGWQIYRACDKKGRATAEQVSELLSGIGAQS